MGAALHLAGFTLVLPPLELHTKGNTMVRAFKNTFIWVCALLSVNATHAGGFEFDVVGIVSAKTPSTFTLERPWTSKPIEVLVTPLTKIEVESHRGFISYDYRIDYKDLQVGEWVTVELYPTGDGRFVAKDIELVR